MQALKAAFRKVRITPEELTPLQGYNPNDFIADPSKDILDDLYARVIVLDDGMSRCVIVSVDCCLTNETTFQAIDPGGKPFNYRHILQAFPEGTRLEWGRAAGVEMASVTVHATHTHSAPEHIGPKYTSRIEEAVREAASSLQPVRLRAGAGKTGISVNRRPSLQHNDALPIDRTLTVVVFESEDGHPLGSIVNCAVHPTLLKPFNRVSSEFVGLAMTHWEEAAGEHFVSVFLQGFSGDVGPFGHYRSETEDTYPWVERLGRQFYEEITELSARTEPMDALPLRCLEYKAELPTRPGYFKPVLLTTLIGIRIGKLLLLCASCETFNGYIPLVKPGFDAFEYSMFSGVANGYTGYLPTMDAFRDGLGGYEMNTTPYTEQACGIFEQTVIQLIGQLTRVD